MFCLRIRESISLCRYIWFCNNTSWIVNRLVAHVNYYYIVVVYFLALFPWPRMNLDWVSRSKSYRLFLRLTSIICTYFLFRFASTWIKNFKPLCYGFVHILGTSSLEISSHAYGVGLLSWACGIKISLRILVSYKTLTQSDFNMTIHREIFYNVS